MLAIHTKDDAIAIDEVGENGERYLGIRDMTVLSKMLGKKFGLQTREIFHGKWLCTKLENGEFRSFFFL